MLLLERLSDNLNSLMKKRRVTTNLLARHTNIPASTIKKLRNSSNTNPTLATLMPIANYFSVTFEQLIREDLRTCDTTTLSQKKISHLPLISWEQSLQWPHNSQHLTKHEIITDLPLSEMAYSLVINTEEWAQFPQGTILLIDPECRVSNLDIVVTHKLNQHFPTLKQYLYEDDQIWLKSLTISNNVVPLTHEHRVLGVVIEYRNRLKNIINLNNKDV